MHLVSTLNREKNHLGSIATSHRPRQLNISNDKDNVPYHPNKHIFVSQNPAADPHTFNRLGIIKASNPKVANVIAIKSSNWLQNCYTKSILIWYDILFISKMSRCYSAFHT